MSDPRALWLVPVAPLGGVARHVLDATRAGIPGWEITVLCPEGSLAERLRAQGAPVIAAGFGPEHGIRSSQRALAAAVRAMRPRIVHSHLAYADIINAWTRLPAGTQRFTTEHGIAGDDGVYHRSGLQARSMALVHRLRFSRFDGVIAVSGATRDAMIAKWHVRQPITVIPNGVDLPQRDAAGPGHPEPLGNASGLRVLALSRLAPEKRLDVLIDAFALVHREQPGATLTIGGEGPLASALEAQAQRLGLGDAVSLPGMLEPTRAMAAADVLAQLSVWENCSYTLLDAAVRGLRVVATDVGGNSEIVNPASLLSGVTAETVAQALMSSADAPAPMPALSTTAQMCAELGRRYSIGRDAC